MYDLNLKLRMHLGEISSWKVSKFQRYRRLCLLFFGKFIELGFECFPSTTRDEREMSIQNMGIQLESGNPTLVKRDVNERCSFFSSIYLFFALLFRSFHCHPDMGFASNS